VNPAGRPWRLPPDRMGEPQAGHARKGKPRAVGIG
jgi:hypothetical protein